jgi:glyoxylase-like metal-dependent hydrolase (beta-lactamase superfamily II)
MPALLSGDAARPKVPGKWFGYHTRMPTLSHPWFTIDELDATTYAISEYGHWEHTHQYLFIGRSRAALVDTGLGVADIGAVVRQLTQLPVIVITTHAHWDHTGGHGLFPETAVHTAEAAWLEQGPPMPLSVIRSSFLKEPLTKQPPDDFSIDRYVPFKGKATHLLSDNDAIDLGGRVLSVLHTPGHAPGHLCVYEPERGYLATGDLLYEGQIDVYYESTDPVLFAQSIARVSVLPQLGTLLPGHHRLQIPVSYMDEARDACESLAAGGHLHHGAGLHQFDHFSVKL